jgi:tetratricopeptide (TPR) repeat protein
MKKLMTLLTGGLLLAAVQLSAQTASAKPVIMTTDGEEIRAASVELTQSGDFRYAESLKDGSPKLTVRKNRVRWAWVPKPDEITAADKLLTNKKYEEAATTFAGLVKSFGPLGWEPYCKLRQAEALDASGKQSEAIKALETLKDFPNTNTHPRIEADLSEAYELLIKFYANIKAWDKGLELSKKLMYAGDAAAVNALFARGDILSARASETNSQDDRRDAFNAYAQISLLFPKSSRAAEATFRAYQTLTVLNDARAKIFADRLKKDYPKSDYAKQL